MRQILLTYGWCIADYHIPSTAAPKVIARFGTMKNLVSQVLEPTLGIILEILLRKVMYLIFLKTVQQGKTKQKSILKERWTNTM